MKSQRRPCERRDPYSAAFAVGKDRQRRPHKNNCGQRLWVPAFAGTTEGFRTQFSKSRRMGTQLRSPGASRPKFYKDLPCSNQEGAGKTGCALHPRSRVQRAQKNTHTSIQVQREHPGLPCAMALRLTSCSPRRTALLPPSPREKLRLSRT